jgi:hypothetical protein
MFGAQRQRLVQLVRAHERDHALDERTSVDFRPQHDVVESLDEDDEADHVDEQQRHDERAAALVPSEDRSHGRV